MIKILDFGLAKIQSEGAIDGGLTLESQMLGTPDFMAPEQIGDSRRADIRADIYSLGCTLYYLLTGQPPFRGDVPLQVMIAHAREPVVPPRQIVSDVPEDLETVIIKCLAKEPYQRYADSGEINTTVTSPAATVAAIAEHERKAGASVDTLDGLTVEHGDWWYNVRPSNTEPLLRLCLESLRSPEHMAEKRDEVLGLIRS